MEEITKEGVNALAALIELKNCLPNQLCINERDNNQLILNHPSLMPQWDELHIIYYVCLVSQYLHSSKFQTENI